MPFYTLGFVVFLLLPRLLSPGVTMWAPVLLAGGIWAGLISTGERLSQRGIWRISPLLTAVPLAFVVWAARGVLSELAGPAMVVLLVLLGARELIEVAIATAVVGAFFAQNATIMNWYAVPAAVGLLASPLLLLVQFGLQAAARRSAVAGRARLAGLAAVLAVPFSLLQRGAERADAVSFVGSVFWSTGKERWSIPWKRWAVAIYRRRGRVSDQIESLHDLAVCLGQAGRPTAGLAAVGQARLLVGQERLPQWYLMRPEVPAAAVRLLDLRTEYEAVELALVEADLRRDVGDLQGALALADAGLEELVGEEGLLKRCETLSAWATIDRRGLGKRVKPAKQLKAEVTGTYIDYLMFRSGMVGSLLHDEALAAELLARALRAAEDSGDTFREVMITVNQAGIMTRLRRYDDAVNRLRRARELADGLGTAKSGGILPSPVYVAPQVHFTIMVLSAMANNRRLQGNLDEAAQLYQQALELAARYPQPVGTTARLGMALVQLAKGQVGEARQHVGIALAEVDRANTESSTRLGYLVAGKVYEKDDPNTAHHYYRRAIEQLESSRASLAGEEERLEFLGGEPRVEVFERMVATCVELGRPAEAFDYAERGKARALAERLGAGADGAAEPASHHDSKVMLDQKTLLVQYFTTADTIVVIGVRGDWDEPKAVVVPIGRDSVRRFTMTNFGSAGRVRELVSTGLEDLWHGYDPLVAPISAWSRPDDLVVLAPHGMLHYLPLHALRLDGQYLIERNPVSYTSSASVLRACRAAAGGREAGRCAAVFGDPGGDLPHARSEAEIVAELMATRPLLGGEVTLEAFTGAAVGAGIVHYAGHAAFDANDPMASGLRLADGILSARDVAAMPGPHPRLVSLSGCETGVSMHHPGDDLLGLVRGFLGAGTPAVVASLWRVSDDSSAHLMKHFYERLPHTTAADALRQAVLEVRGQGGRWRSLYHWAPFILTGDWE